MEESSEVDTYESGLEGIRMTTLLSRQEIRTKGISRHP